MFLLLLIGSAQGAVLTQCPPVGADVGCGILITITASSGGSATSFNVIAASSPSQGPYDNSEDTLVGVLNSSGATVNTLALTSTTDIFGFDGDGPCTVTPNPGNCNSADPNGYAGPGVTFSGLSANGRSGVVNFTGGLADGQSRWFGLEESLTPSQILPGGVPEPGSIALFTSGFGALVVYARRHRANS